MSSTALARRDWPAFGPTTGAAEHRRVLISGLAAGGVGAAPFIVINSLLIAPIWTRFLGHMPFCVSSGVALSAARRYLTSSETE